MSLFVVLATNDFIVTSLAFFGWKTLILTLEIALEMPKQPRLRCRLDWWSALIGSLRISMVYWISAAIGRWGVPQIAIFWSKNDVERMLKYAKTATVKKNLIPYSERRENFLSISIQHIYSLNHQKAMPTFIKHAKCKNSPKKSMKLLLKWIYAGKWQ